MITIVIAILLAPIAVCASYMLGFLVWEHCGMYIGKIRSEIKDDIDSQINRCKTELRKEFKNTLDEGETRRRFQKLAGIR